MVESERDSMRYCGSPGQARAQAEGAAAGPLPQPAQGVLEAAPGLLVVQLHALQAGPAGMHGCCQLGETLPYDVPRAGAA